jgi:bacterioferritin
MANEMNTMLMYLQDSLVARGGDSLPTRELASDFAQQDFLHVQRLAERIVELEGTPELAPSQIADNASVDMRPPDHGDTWVLLKHALENEMQSVIEYKHQIQTIGFDDPTTRLLLEQILADKEHQAEEVRRLMHTGR